MIPLLMSLPGLPGAASPVAALPGEPPEDAPFAELLASLAAPTAAAPPDGHGLERLADDDAINGAPDSTTTQPLPLADVLAFVTVASVPPHSGPAPAGGQSTDSVLRAGVLTTLAPMHPVVVNPLSGPIADLPSANPHSPFQAQTPQGGPELKPTAKPSIRPQKAVPETPDVASIIPSAIQANDVLKLVAARAGQTAQDALPSVTLTGVAEAERQPLATLPVASQNAATPIVAAGPAPVPASPVPVTRPLDLTDDAQWLDTLARDIAAVAREGGRLRFALSPETMGRLDVEVRREEAGVHIHLAAHREVARELLDAAQPRIADEIRAQGIRLAGTQVSTGFDDRDARGGARPAPAIEALVPNSVEARQPVAAPRITDTGRYA